MADRRLRRRVDSWLARRNARVGGFNPWQVFADALHASGFFQRWKFRHFRDEFRLVGCRGASDIRKRQENGGAEE